MRSLLVLTLAGVLAWLAEAQTPKKPDRPLPSPPTVGKVGRVRGDAQPRKAAAKEQIDRRDRRQPELVLDTGGRTGTCDVLQFTSEGKHLLAAGDDKVVRAWEVRDGKLTPAAVPLLRWSVWREQRGAIYALALGRDFRRPSDKSGDRMVAIAGLGLLTTPAVVVLDRDTGEVAHHLPDFDEKERFTHGTVRAVAFAPSGRRIAFGSSDGRVWLWDLVEKACREVYRLPFPTTNEPTPWRLLHFEAEGRLLGVCEARGHVVRLDLTKGSSTTWDFGFRVYVAALSRSGQWLAATGKYEPRLEVRSVDGRQAKQAPPLGERNHRTCLAFSPDGRELAVGVGQVARGEELEGDDHIAFFDLTGSGQLRRKLTLPHRYHCDAIAYDPSGEYLAVAGGDNHEVRLFRRAKLVTPTSTMVGVGRCIWDVALSPDGRQLGFRDQRSRDDRRPNHRGAGPWRVFDLYHRTFLSDTRKFRPDPERGKSADGWRIDFARDPKHSNRWAAVHDELKLLYWLDPDLRREGHPRCYAFLPADRAAGTPTRLLVGHDQGVIRLYELDKAKQRLRRVFVGGQGEVTALAVAADGRWFVSASSDQTITAWSLESFAGGRYAANHPEFGARFVLSKDRKVVVPEGGVTPFSPAWEAGLLEGDEVVWLVVPAVVKGPVHDPLGREGKVADHPRRALSLLNNPEPARGMEIGVRHKGTGKVHDFFTSVRHRPLWRFFPAQRREWALWAWHQPYYVCSENADKWLGPQLNDANSLGGTPTVYPLHQLHTIFHKPEVVGKLLQTRDLAEALPRQAASLEYLALVRLEPPAVRFEEVSLLGPRGKLLPLEAARGRIHPVQAGEDVRIRVLARPSVDHRDHRPHRAELWLNEYQIRSWEPRGESLSFSRQVRVRSDLLRSGKNRLTFLCYNFVHGLGEVRAEKEYEVVLDRARRPGPANLHALVVGVRNYAGLNELPFAEADARALAAALQRPNEAYWDRSITPLLNADASRQKVLAYLDGLASSGKVGPDDLLVLFLAGHGLSESPREGRPKQFLFCCPDFDPDRLADTTVSAEDLLTKLAKLPCRKLLLLDACRSGRLATNPLRDFAPSGKGPTILAACEHRQASYEPAVAGKGGINNGLFTHALLEALGSEFPRADRNRDGVLDERELYEYIDERLPELLANIGHPEGEQIPKLSLPGDDPYPLFRPPLTPASPPKAGGEGAARRPK